MQQQYLRARFYDPANGRFNRLDPFAGNMQDPQSLHKYAYVHGDPLNASDPTGLMSLGSIQVSISTQAMLVGAGVGAVSGAVTGAMDAWLGGGSADEILEAAKWGGAIGAVLGLFTGGFGGAIASKFATLSMTARLRILRSLLFINLAGTGYGVATSTTFSQGGFRAATGLFGMLGLLRTAQVVKASRIGSTSVATQRLNSVKALDSARGAHSYADHAADVSPTLHLRRLRTGQTPRSGGIRPTTASGGFSSHEKHLEAYEEALVRLWGIQENPVRTNGHMKKLVSFEFDLPDAGTSWVEDPGSLMGMTGRPANRVKAVFKLNTEVDPNADGFDYALWTMYPIE